MLEADTTRDLTINSLGYRGKEFNHDKAKDTYRILLLGDSFAINSAIPDQYLHTTILEEKLNASSIGQRRYEIVNCGYANGYSPDSYIAYMLQKGFDLKPDMVIMQFFIRNDFKDLLETEILEYKNGLPFRVRSKYRYVDKTGRYRKKFALQYKIPCLRNMNLYIHLYDVCNEVAGQSIPCQESHTSRDSRQCGYGIRYRNLSV